MKGAVAQAVQRELAAAVEIADTAVAEMNAKFDKLIADAAAGKPGLELAAALAIGACHTARQIAADLRSRMDARS